MAPAGLGRIVATRVADATDHAAQGDGLPGQRLAALLKQLEAADLGAVQRDAVAPHPAAGILDHQAGTRRLRLGLDLQAGAKAEPGDEQEQADRTARQRRPSTSLLARAHGPHRLRVRTGR